LADIQSLFERQDFGVHLRLAESVQALLTEVPDHFMHREV
jgi:hypothetical protein